MNDQKLRASLIRLAHAKPELRAEILPLLKQAKGAKIEIAGKSYGAEDLASERHIIWDDANKEVKDAFGPQFLDNSKKDTSIYKAWNTFSLTLDKIRESGKKGDATEQQLKKLEKAYEAIQQEIKKAPAKKTAGIGTMQVGYIKNDALDLVDAVKDQEGIVITFLQLLDSCTAFARLGLHNTAVSALLDKAVNILAESEGDVLDTTGGPSRTRID